MNRTDRLLAIVLALQAKKLVRAEDLAETFAVSKRTIYRDMLALDESGVPVLAIPGQGYALVEGYFLPPLTFSAEEATILLLGSGLVAQNFDAQYRDAAQSASDKILTVLPDTLRREVDYLKDSIQFMAFNPPAPAETLNRLRLLRQAIIQCRTVQFRYHARGRSDKTDAETTRETDPYALIHIGGAWMLVAYCHLRRDIRHFRLDRMESAVIITDRTFTRPPDFKVEPSPQDDRRVLVRVLFDTVAARLMQESPSLYQVAQENRSDGLLVTLAVRRAEDVLGWLLGWGSHVRILEPESLHDMVVREAQAILESHFQKP